MYPNKAKFSINTFSFAEFPKAPPSTSESIAPIPSIIKDIIKKLTDDNGERNLYFLNIIKVYIENEIMDVMKNINVLFPIIMKHKPIKETTKGRM